MQQRNVGCLVVTDTDNRPIGIVTDRDLVLRVVAAMRDPDGTTVAEVMTPEPATILEDGPPEAALAFMKARSIRRLPVVNDQNIVVGILSLDDVLRFLAQDLATVSDLLAAEGPAALDEPDE
jgi:CBS domain-containing protein